VVNKIRARAARSRFLALFKQPRSNQIACSIVPVPVWVAKPNQAVDHLAIESVFLVP